MNVMQVRQISAILAITIAGVFAWTQPAYAQFDGSGDSGGGSLYSSSGSSGYGYDAGSLYSASTPDYSSLYSASSPSSGSLYSASSADSGSLYSAGSYSTGSLYSASTPDYGSLYSASAPSGGSLYSASSVDTGSLYSASSPSTGNLYSASSDTGSLYSASASTPYTTFYPDTQPYTTFYPDNSSYTNFYPDTASYGGGIAPMYGGGGYGYSSGFYAAPFYSTPIYSSFAYNTPSYVPSSNTNVINNGNTTDSYNTSSCTTPNSCNTTISSPTTISYNNSGGGSSYPVYYPVSTPTYQAPTCTMWFANANVGGPYETLYWSSANATTGYISGVGTVASAGSTVVNNASYANYTGTFSGSGGSTTCYANAPAPVAYNQAPYVTLSQVPYTGLDLGPVGTVLYWLFLVLWCAVAAYLIAVKRVHNSILNWGYARLFGNPSVVSHPVYRAASAHRSEAAAAEPSTPKPQQPAVHPDAIDDFIRSQINRAA